jgi:hypothetical protein
VARYPELSRRRLNRAVLARQLLVERITGDPPQVLAEACRRMATLQAQYAPSMYVGLWSRVEGFERDHLDAALTDRTIIQGTLQRGTIHLVDRADYWPFAVAVRHPRRHWFLRATRLQDEAPLARAAAVVADALVVGPVRQKQVDALLGPDGSARIDRGNAAAATTLAVRNGVGYWLDLVRVPPSGTWVRRRADLYDLAERWAGPEDVDPEQAARHVVRSYLTGFGPAAPQQIANWAGLPATTVTQALAGLEAAGQELARYTDAEDGAELVDLPGLPLPDEDAEVPVRLLGTWDAGLLAHARRAGMLPERHRERVFHVRQPQSVNTVLVDGEVRGAWTWPRDPRRDTAIGVEEYERWPRAVRAAVAAETRRLSAAMFP